MSHYLHYEKTAQTSPFIYSVCNNLGISDIGPVGIILPWQRSAFVNRKSHKQFFSWRDSIITDVALFRYHKFLCTRINEYLNNMACQIRLKRFFLTSAYITCHLISSLIAVMFLTRGQFHQSTYDVFSSYKHRTKSKILFHQTLQTCEVLTFCLKFTMNILTPYLALSS